MWQEGTRSTLYLWDRYQVGVHAEGVCARLDPVECSSSKIADPPQIVRDAIKARLCPRRPHRYHDQHETSTASLSGWCMYFEYSTMRSSVTRTDEEDKARSSPAVG